MTQALEQIGVEDEAAWDGLFIRVHETIPPLSKGAGPGIDGVIWVQRAAGNTAVVWASPEVGETSAALLAEAARLIDAGRVPLAQLVVSEGDGYSPEQNERCGFPKFAELQYLFAEVERSQSAMAPGSDGVTRGSQVQQREILQFVARAGDEPQRLGALIEQTYIGTLDCPALDGIRPMSDVLEGYRCQGRHSPVDWYFVQRDDKDVGALLLTEHPGFGNWELVYMGVVPHARGKKYGEAMIRFALEVAGSRGAERLVLAVDADNVPALRAYERCGFVAWDRRIVYARLRTPSQHSAHAALPRS
jgi:mycothiol synthase